MRKISYVLLSIFLILSGLISFNIPAKAAVPSSGLVLDLRAGKSTSYSGSGTTWNDLSGNGNNATFQGSPTWSNTNGGQFAMDGTDYFSLSAGMANFTSGITVSAYVNFGNIGIWERIIDFGNGSTANNILLARFSDTNDLAFEIYNGATSQGHCRLTNGILVNTWATYAVTLNGSNCLIYRDGTLQQTTTYTALPQNVSRANNYIGKSNWADAYFDTGISALAIYNRALNSTEISDLSAAQKDQISPTYFSGSSFSVAENQTSIATLSANETSSWSIISGTDSGKFSLNSSTGVLTFQTAPNFESPTDVGANNVYNFSIRITDSVGNITDVSLAVTITNVDETTRVDTFTVSANPTYRSSVTLTVYPTLAGNVIFRANNVKISGCTKVSTTVFSPTYRAICTWRPSSRGKVTLSATFTPTNTNYNSSSATAQTFVMSRVSPR